MARTARQKPVIRTVFVTSVTELPLWLTVPQAAELWHVSTRTIYQMVAERKIPAQHFGRTVRIPRSAISGESVTGTK